MSRIIHLIGQLETGGCELQLLGLAGRLAEHGHHTIVCSFHGTGGRLGKEFNENGVPTLFLDKSTVGRARFMRSLLSALRFIEPDIVHTWLPDAYFGGAWAARLTGHRFIVASERSEVRKNNAVLSLSARLLGRRRIWTANSEAGAVSLSRHYGVRLDRIRESRNGVQLELPGRVEARRSIRAELGLSDNVSVVLMVASQSPVKNYPMFIRAAARVAKENPATVFVGIGKARNDKYRELARGIGCRNVVLLGERKDVTLWYAGADVFCLTSFLEGAPNALLEAMYSGLPVVATSFSSATEIIDDGENGYLVPIDDDRALAERVLGLLDMPNERMALGNAAHRRVLQEFSWDKALEQFESLYQSVLALPTS